MLPLKMTRLWYYVTLHTNILIIDMLNKIKDYVNDGYPFSRKTAILQD